VNIIPAIDLIGGKCVRLEQGDYAKQTTYSSDPLSVAQEFEAAGVTRLHLVDLDGAKAGKLVNLNILEQLAANTSLQIDFGGGVKTAENVQHIIDAGAKYVALGSIAVKSPELLHQWITDFGAARFFIGADVRGTKLAVNGWLEQTDIEIVPFLNQYLGLGVNQFFCTDISRDGLLAGPSTELYKDLLAQCSGLQLTASGGVSSLSDLNELAEAGCVAVIVGKAIYEERISLKQLSEFISRQKNNHA
jgi:phosphoribosylformimino-5-aminoimidazole carboxamide ribotide isomerase